MEDRAGKTLSLAVCIIIAIGVLVISLRPLPGQALAPGPEDHASRIASLEMRVAALEDKIVTLELDIQCLRLQAAQTTYVFERLDDALEGRFQQGVE